MHTSGNTPANGFSVSWDLRKDAHNQYNLYMVVHDKLGVEFMRKLYWACGGSLSILLLMKQVAEVWGVDKVEYLVELSRDASEKQGNFWEHLRSNLEKLFIKRED